jgi:uncharacterized protein involved in exopolysaccharide biosynthesis
MTELIPRSNVAFRPSDEDEYVDIGRYVSVLLRGWWLLAVGGVVGILAAVTAGSLAPSRYASSALLRISPPRFGQAVAGSAASVQAMIDTRGVAAAVVREMGLDQPPHNLSPRAFMDSALAVESVPATNLIRISVRLPDRTLPAETVTKLTTRVLEESRALGREEAGEYTRQMKQQLDGANARLMEAEQGLFAFRKEAQIEALEEQYKTRVKQQDSLSETDAERARLKEGEDQLAKTPRTLTLKGGSDFTDGPASLSTTVTAATPESGSSRREVLNPSYDQLQLEIARTRSRLAALQRTREELRASPPSVPLTKLYQMRQRLAQLETEYDLAMRLYSDRATNYANARMQADLAGDELRVVQRATPAEKPLSRRLMLLAVLGGAVGLGLASAVLLVRSNRAERRLA